MKHKHIFDFKFLDMFLKMPKNLDWENYSQCLDANKREKKKKRLFLGNFLVSII